MLVKANYEPCEPAAKAARMAKQAEGSFGKWIRRRNSAYG